MNGTFKNTTTDSQILVWVLMEPNRPTTVSSGYCNMAEVQDKDRKIVFINMIEVLKKEMNKSLKDACENTSSGWK